MKFRFPLIKQFTSYRKEMVINDLVAGLTVGVMLVPQGMAYAFLAGVPAVYGLYASIVPLFLYMLLGSSRYVTIGPSALIAILIITGLNSLEIKAPSAYLNAVFVIALLSGSIQVLLGLFRLGNIINFIAQPVLKGFIIGAAFTIMLSQFKHVFGIPVEGRQSLSVLIQLFSSYDSANISTILIGLGGILFLLLLKKLGKRFPSQLVLVVLSIGVVFALNLDKAGVQILGEVPGGMPSLHFPAMNWSLIEALLPVSFTIALVSFIEAYAIGVALQEKSDKTVVNPNKELIALGAGKLVGSFFQAFPTSGSFSRSAVNKQAGTQTNLSGFYTIAIIILTLLFLTPYFYFLPKAALGAIIIVAIIGLIDFHYIKSLYRIDKRDFMLLTITVCVTFLIGIQQGILTGIILSIVLLVYNTSYPHIVELGLIKGTKTLRNVKRFKHIEVDKRILIVRIDAPLSFSNATHFANKLNKFEQSKKNLAFVLLNASSIDYMDSTALDKVKTIAQDYEKRGIRFAISGLKGPVRDKFQRLSLFEEIGKSNFFIDDIAALQAYQHGHEDQDQGLTFQAN